MGCGGDGGRGLSDPAGLMRAAHVGAWLVCLALVTGCATHSRHAAYSERSAAARSAGSYVVQRGDTLYSIAWRNGLDYQTVAAWNRIAPPYTIYPGQRILLRAPGSAPSRTKFVSGTQTAAPGQRPAPPASTPDDDPMPSWQWPANGPVLRRFDADSTGKKGISIGGTLGTPVRAAAAGTVVYAGSGLVGYGRLIIVKHNDTYLSAYGHNKELRVNEGDAVRAGQVIAEMGSSGTNRIQLHFEIRRQGKPVDPLRYLPRR